MVDFEKFGQEVRKTANEFAAGATKAAGDVSDSISESSAGFQRAKRFTECGSDLFLTKAVTSHGGNLSESDGSVIWITHTDSMLGHLTSADLVKTTWQPSESDAGCSRELVVHRAMYFGYAQSHGYAPGTFDAAIVHAHTRHTIARSLREDLIVPIDSEGLFTLGSEGIKVFSPAESIGSAEGANMLGEAVFGGMTIGIIKGHGPFAIAPSLQEAHRLVSVLEASCEILDIMDMEGHAE